MGFLDAFKFSPKSSLPPKGYSSQKPTMPSGKPKTIFEKVVLGNDKYIHSSRATERFIRDSKGDIYKATGGLLTEEKRKKLISEITEGLKETPGGLKLNNYHSVDWKKAADEFKKEKRGAFKNLFIEKGKEKERAELKKTLESLSKTVPLDASKNKFSRN
jgi:hypothetical protein